MSSLVYVLLFVFGLGVGSFLNVLAVRYQPGGRLFSAGTIFGRSRCPGCQTTLSWKELIPILSFLIQKGRCRSCGAKISFQYPLVEILSGLAAVFAPAYFIKVFNVKNLFLIGELPSAFYFFSFVWVFVLWFLILLSVIDFYHYLIPDIINAALIFLGVVVAALKYYFGTFSEISGSFVGHYALLFGFRDNVFANHFTAALLAALFFGAVILATRGRAMGMGDLKLAAALGFLFGWPDIALVLILAFLIGAVLGVALMIAKKKTRKDFVPFGPFLALAAVFVFFFGYQIVGWYFKLFNI